MNSPSSIKAVFRLLPIVLTFHFGFCRSTLAAGEKAEWKVPVMRAAVLWLLYDDWGQDHRAYGFDRIEEASRNRPKPESLVAAKTIHLDTSGWGGRASFLYAADTKSVVPMSADAKTLRSLYTIRLSVQNPANHYTAKIWWDGQLFFLNLELKGDRAVVVEFTDCWLTMGKKPS